jgi:hypothetical protein
MQAVCPWCESLNPVGNEFCGNCGGPLQYAKVVDGEEPRVLEKKATPRKEPRPKARRTSVAGKCLLVVLTLFLISCTVIISVSLFIQSTPSYKATSTARAAATGTRQAIAEVTREAEAALAATQTAIAARKATATAIVAATTTGLANATATAQAAPTETASAATASAATAIVAPTQTAGAVTATAATAIAQVTVVARKTATAQAHANATATIEAYKKVPPKGVWSAHRTGIYVTVGNFEYESAGGQYRYVGFGVRVDNDTDGSIHVNPFNCTLVDLNGATYEHDEETYSHYSNPLPGVDVSPGNYAYGGIVFRIPNNTGPGKFVYRDPLGPTIEINLTRPPDRTE